MWVVGACGVSWCDFVSDAKDCMYYAFCMFILHVVCFIVLLNCLLNMFVIGLGVQVLNVMVLFCVQVGLLLHAYGCMDVCLWSTVCLGVCLFSAL